MSWEVLDTTWQDICAGRLCCLCQAAMSAPKQAGFRYCTGCVPTPADTPHLVYIAIDHHNEGWSVTLSSNDPPAFTFWMIDVSDDAMSRMVRRARISPHCRAWHERAMQAWGRCCFYAHMTAEQLRNLRRAHAADPRNAYEKRNNLLLGSSDRIRG